MRELNSKELQSIAGGVTDSGKGRQQHEKSKP